MICDVSATQLESQVCLFQLDTLTGDTGLPRQLEHRMLTSGGRLIILTSGQVASPLSRLFSPFHQGSYILWLCFSHPTHKAMGQVWDSLNFRDFIFISSLLNFSVNMCTMCTQWGCRTFFLTGGQEVHFQPCKHSQFKILLWINKY